MYTAGAGVGLGGVKKKKDGVPTNMPLSSSEIGDTEKEKYSK